MVKIDIISGFLGAGKTTLIQKLLKEALAGSKVVLIENEFGEIGIDSGFLQESGVEIREMNSGCICCSLVGDFKTSLQEVLAAYTPDRIIIEPSGVGKLSEVVQAVEGVGEDIQITGKVTVVDVNKCKMYLKNFGEFFQNQVEQADTILLSRTGTASAEKVQKAVELLRQHNDHAVIVTTPWEQLDGADLLNEMERTGSMEEELLAEVHVHEHHHEHGEHCTCGHEHHHEHHHEHGEHCTCGHEHHHEHHHEHGEHCTCGHEHHHEHHHEHGEHCTCGHEHHHEHHHEHGEHCTCGHEHHHHHADEVFVSWGMETPAVYSREQVENILAALEQQDVYGMVLRAKGMLPSADGTWTYFDYVPGEWEVRSGKPAVTGKICVIGSGLKQDALQSLFTA
ncbi:MAG: cobalamin biosynthesis protein CobW [Peptococcaceae bacterium]|nr:cobalamin biosynthesis protein CobW [Peptococcaceae bacterium]